MTDISIFLGSCTGPGICAATLQEVAAGAPQMNNNNSSGSSNTPWESISITVQASELTTIFANPMDLASIPFTKNVTIRIIFKEDNNDTTTKSSSLPSTLNLQCVHTAFLLAGCQSTMERKDSNTRVLMAQKTTTISQPVVASAVRLPTKNGNVLLEEDTTNIIDEDDLLNQEDDTLAPDMKGVVVASKDDCGGREPCDDCTCGRRTEPNNNNDEKKEDNLVEQIKAPIKTSSCGKCGLGDAFRCASCPYLGMPAFKAGEEHLVLEMHDDL